VSVRRDMWMAAGAFVLATSILRAQEAGGDNGNPSQPTGVEQRIRALEDEVRDMRDNGAKVNARLGLDQPLQPAFVKAVGKETALRLGGLIQAQADGGDRGDKRWSSDNTRFYLRRARLNASGDFAEGFDYKIELDLAGTLGEQSAFRAQLTDGYITWKTYAPTTLRVGQFKTPFGYEFLVTDPTLFTIERSLASDRLTLSRQVGGQLGGEFLAKRGSYAAGAFNGSGVNTSANDNDELLYAGRAACKLLQTAPGVLPARLALGGSAFTSEDNLSGQPAEFGFASTTTGKVDNVFVGKRTGWSADIQAVAGPFELWAEYLETRYEPDSAKPAAEFAAAGWYVQAACFVVPSRLQAVVKYETYDPSDVRVADATDTWTFGLNCCIRGDDLKLQFDYLRSDVPDKDGDESKYLARLQAIF
jgi:phosphate-selective porin OprO and OprP